MDECEYEEEYEKYKVQIMHFDGRVQIDEIICLPEFLSEAMSNKIDGLNRGRPADKQATIRLA